MSRTIAALYDTRAEAESARAALMSEIRTKSPRIIAKDTVGALIGLNIAESDKAIYREGLVCGGHLLVAEAGTGENVDRIIEVLTQGVGAMSESGDHEAAIGDEIVRIEEPDLLPIDEPHALAATTADNIDPEQPRNPRGSQSGKPYPAFAQLRSPDPTEQAAISAAEEEPSAAEQRVPWRGVGASLPRDDAPADKSSKDEAPTAEKIACPDASVAVETRPCERRLEDGEGERKGLFRDRIFEFSEMREQPVVTKTAVVREELIVRKTMNEHIDTAAQPEQPPQEEDLRYLSVSERAERRILERRTGKPAQH